ncbi:MAG: site-specific integrase [Mesorhizobium sp.]|nr:MAG: site-specific integrase [Mesorhizobium sp.]
MASLTKRNGRWTATARLPDTFRGPAKSRSINQTFVKKSDARLWLESTESAMKLGTWADPRLEVKQFGALGWPERPLKDALDSYRQKMTPEKKGASQEIAMLNMLARTDLAQKRIREISVSDVMDYRIARLAEGKSNSTVRNNLNTFSAVYHWLIHIEKVKIENPIASIREAKKMPQPGRGRERRLRTGEEVALVSAISQIEGPDGRQWGILFPLLLETGMRLGEALSIRVGWLRAEYGFIVVPDSKNSEPRHVALSDATFDLLLQLAEGEDEDNRLFRFVEQTAKNLWRYDIRPAAGCVGLTIHDLRHEALSRMVARGVNIKILMRQSGHKTVAVLMRYLNPTPAEQRAALFPDDVQVAQAA